MLFPPIGKQLFLGILEHVESELLLGVRLRKLLPVKQMEIWYSTGFILLCTMPHNFRSWISMWFQLDKSNMSSPVLMYNHLSESPCLGHPVSTLWSLIYDWQLIWRSQNTTAWPAEHDSIGENSSRPIRLPANSLAPLPSVYLPPYASPKKLINL